MGDVAQAQAVVELMVLSAWADGQVVGSEALMIHKLVAAYPELREVGPTGDLSSHAREQLERVGLEAALRETARAVTEPRYRELAFQCCAKVMGADGQFTQGEATVLGSLQAFFGFTAADVNRLLVLATR